MSLSNITPEQREANLAKARQAKQEKREWAEKNLRLEWADETFHIELAKEYGYKLPQRYDQAAGKFVQRFLKHFKLESEWYQDHSGFKNGNEEARVNPWMSAREQVGILLELYDDDVKHQRISV